MRRFPFLVLLLLLLPLVVRGAAEPPSVEVIYVPTEDISRAPGYTAKGAMLPLSEILDLARRAGEAVEAGSDAGLTINSCALTGEFASSFNLEAAVSFSAVGSGWVARRIDTGKLPWNSQAASEQPMAFVARIEGNAYLFALAPSEGELRLRSAIPVRQEAGEARLALGGFVCPASVRLSVPAGWEMGEAPKSLTAELADGKREYRFLLAGKEDHAVVLRRARFRPDGTEPLVFVRRTISPLPGALEVVDVVGVTQGAKSPVGIVLPDGLTLLEAEAVENGTLARQSGAYLLEPETLGGSEARFRFTAPLEQDVAELPPLKIEGVTTSEVVLRSSEERVLVVEQGIAGLQALDSQVKGERVYTSAGEVVGLRVRSLPGTLEEAPVVSGCIRVDRGVAKATYKLCLKHDRKGELVFQVADAWGVVGAKANADSTDVPVGVQRRAGNQWSLSWQGSPAEMDLTISLQQLGDWGSKPVPVPVEFPALSLPGRQLAPYAVALQWPEDLKVLVGAASGAELLSREESTGLAEWGPSQGAVRIDAAASEVSITVEGRAPDVRTTVVTTVSVDEDEARVRSTMDFAIRFAPVSRFRFVLPRNAAGSLRIDGEGIRESRHTARGDREEWEVVTQRAQDSSYRLTLAWTLARGAGAAAFEAPVVEPLGVASQRGFLVLEGSESLLLSTSATNLSETDVASLPEDAAARSRRIISVYQYTQPIHRLTVRAERFEAEQSIGGIVREAELSTVVTPHGERFTRAAYRSLTRSSRQFFELELPEKAVLWSTEVDGEGAKPARRAGPAGKALIMVPLPGTATSREVEVAVVYREEGAALRDATRLAMRGPVLSIPVNRTQWSLNLPPGFEYLSYGGSLGTGTIVREPLLRFARTAYYPRNIIHEALTIPRTILLSLLLAAGWFLWGPVRRFLGRWRSQPAARAEGERSGCGFLLELLIVGAVVVILAAISVPNFLEAQSRSKVSRVRSDMRSMATAIESYYVDNNAYPSSADVLWQGSVKYLTNAFVDPFASGSDGGSPVSYGGADAGIKYLAGDEAVMRAARAGLAPPTAAGKQFWMLYSYGPDGVDNRGEILYDPTNGTVSSGDVIRTAQVDSPSWNPAFAPTAAREMAGGLAYNPTNGTVSAGDVWRVKQGGPEEYQAQARDGSETKQATTERMLDPASVDLMESAVQLDGVAPAATPAAEKPSTVAAPAGVAEGQQLMVARTEKFDAGAFKRTGLLSLMIALPEGGIRRQFEGLGGEANVEVRFLEEPAFQRWRFAVKMLVFVMLSVVYTLARAFHRPAFLALVTIAGVIPLVAPTPWTVFYNAVIQGALISLIVPLVAATIRLLLAATIRPAHTGAAAALLLVLAGPWMLSTAALAEEAAGQGPVRVIVPYDVEAPRFGEARANAFLSEEDFRRLWMQAQAEQPVPGEGRPLLLDVALDGRFDPASAEIVGELSVLAANPGKQRAALAFPAKGFDLSSARSEPAGAIIEGVAEGFSLTLEAGWAGRIQAGFRMPCKTEGSTGGFSFLLPEAGTGQWSVRLPYATVRPGEGSVFLVEPGASDCVIRGPLTGGSVNIQWTREEARRQANKEKEEDRRVSISVSATWDYLSHARWRADVTLEAGAVPGNGTLPLTLLLDEGLRLFSVSGDGLDSAVLEGRELQVGINGAGSRKIRVSGYFTTTSEAGTWRVPGLRLKGAGTAETSLQLSLRDQIVLGALRPEGMQRVPTREHRQGYTAVSLRSASASWSVEADLKRSESAFAVGINQMVTLDGGRKLTSARILLQPKESRIRELRLLIPAGARLESVSGLEKDVCAAAGDALYMLFNEPRESDTVFTVVLSEPFDSGAGTLVCQPLSAPGASDVEATLCVAVPSDLALVEADIHGAISRTAGEVDRELLGDRGNGGDTRCYTLQSAEPIRFGLNRVVVASRTDVRASVEVGDGMATVDALLRIEPKAGRIRAVRFLLRDQLPEGTDPSAFASPAGLLPADMEVLGRVRTWQVEGLRADGSLVVMAELEAPSARPVDLRVRFSKAIASDQGSEVSVPLVLPEGAAGDHCMLLVSRLLEGELRESNAMGLRGVEPTAANWPAEFRKPQPSDKLFEVAAAAGPGVPIARFSVERHARDAALRAIVEVLRQRSILSEDGTERHELEIVVQNQSEQFLKVALPYVRKDLTVYEVLVAGKPVSVTFGSEGGREVLLVPLIRTGLLEPELTVRVVYTAVGRGRLDGSGSRKQELPEVLGGIPVAQSALVLMLPVSNRYTEFDGTLNEVELVDLEVDEALRRARSAEKISKIALYSKGDVQKKAVMALNRYAQGAEFNLSNAKMINEAYDRVQQRASSVEESGRARQLGAQRGAAIQQAEVFQQQTLSNIVALNKAVGLPENLPGTPPTEPEATVVPPTPGIEFPRIGEVHVFRQLQGTGSISFSFRTRKAESRWLDLGFAVLVLAGVGSLSFFGRRLFATRRRAGAVLAVVAMLALVGGVFIDLAIPCVVIAAALMVKRDRHGEAIPGQA